MKKVKFDVSSFNLWNEKMHFLAKCCGISGITVNASQCPVIGK